MLFTNPATGNTSSGSGCDQLWFINTQTGGNFSGNYEARGHSLTSDKTCGYSGTVSGTIGADGTSVAVRLTPTVHSRGCTRLSGDDTFVGTFTDNKTLRAQVTDLIQCDEIVAEQRAGTYSR